MSKEDFFISYNHKDEQYAIWIAEVLEKNDYTTIIQAWDFNPGDNLVSNINEALLGADRLIVVMSRSYMNSPWCEVEWTAKYHEGISRGVKNIIPVKVEDFFGGGSFRTNNLHRSR